MEMLRTTNIPSSQKERNGSESLTKTKGLHIRKKIGSKDTTGLKRFDLRRTLLDDSLTGTVFDQRHGVKNITMGKKRHSCKYLT